MSKKGRKELDTLRSQWLNPPELQRAPHLARPGTPPPGPSRLCRLRLTRRPNRRANPREAARTQPVARARVRRRLCFSITPHRRCRCVSFVMLKHNLRDHLTSPGVYAWDQLVAFATDCRQPKLGFFQDGSPSETPPTVGRELYKRRFERGKRRAESGLENTGNRRTDAVDRATRAVAKREAGSRGERIRSSSLEPNNSASAPGSCRSGSCGTTRSFAPGPRAASPVAPNRARGGRA